MSDINTTDIPRDSIDYSVIDQSALSVIGFTMSKFLTTMLENLDNAGFQGMEFMSSILLFLKAVTSKYPKEEFAHLLNTMQEIDPEIAKSEFFYALIFMRKISTFEDNMSDVFNFIGLSEKDKNSAKISSAIALFSSHLLQNSIKFIDIIRKDSKYRHYTNNEFKDIIVDNYNSVLHKTLSEIQMR